MAGAGYRTWTPGEVITADNVQNFLQDQTVQVYDNSSARSTALTGYIAEGMLSYLKDTDAVEVYDGSNWVGLGGDAPIFTSGTAGQFLKSLGTAGVTWDSVPTPGSATPTTAGIVFGQTSGTNDSGIIAYGYNAAGSYVPSVILAGPVAIGIDSQKIATGGANTSVGNSTLLSCTSGAGNVALGRQSLGLLTTGGNNTALGSFSGTGLAGGGITTGSNNTIIGFDALPSTQTVSNQITLGNSSVTSLRCAVTSISSLSDERDKKEIEDLPVGLDFVKQLKPVKFVWDTRVPKPATLLDGTVKTFTKDDVKADIPDIGFIAQDLVAAEDALGAHDWLQLTLRDNPDKLEATQGRLIPILVKAIQELSAEVEALKAQLK